MAGRPSAKASAAPCASVRSVSRPVRKTKLGSWKPVIATGPGVRPCRGCKSAASSAFSSWGAMARGRSWRIVPDRAACATIPNASEATRAATGARFSSRKPPIAPAASAITTVSAAQVWAVEVPYTVSP